MLSGYLKKYPNSMLFSFLIYVRPIWYLRLESKDVCTFVDFNKLPSSDQKILEYSSEYSSDKYAILDTALQAWHKGFLPNSDTALQGQVYCQSITDNYLFLRRFFSPVWSWYVLLLRILTVHNPIAEIRGFFMHRKVKRLTLDKNIKIVDPETYSQADPIVLPFVSIIIPTLNRYKYLKDTLLDLEKQSFKNFEVIIVDQSDAFSESFYTQFKMKLKVFHQEEKALWLARNNAIKDASGSLLLLFDDDSRVDPDWVISHIRCLNYFNADLSSGVSLSVKGAAIPFSYSYFKLSDQVDTGNVMIKREVFSKVGLFDRQFEKQRMGDGEFGLRCYLAGLKNISNPAAKRLHLKVNEGGLREMGSWDAFRTSKWFAPRPIPSVLYYYRKYYGNSAAIWAVLQKVPPSIIPYSKKENKLLKTLGYLFVLILMPLIFVQVRRSWYLSSKKLSEGAIIETISTEINAYE